MSSQNNETSLIVVIQAFFVVAILLFWQCIRFFMLCSLWAIKLPLYISIIGIPIATMIKKCEDNVLNPVVNKFFKSLLLMLGIPEAMLGEE
ncbi:hypothetical protein L2E71_12190 [Planktothrix agardhii 1032]|uniref:hypothetical protein n=1 Tax=Planktothrix agardhii TaxID=1160 RepID=UPI001D0B57EC|nr:hypothetical protein [Planktothrix agardhii]MCB8777659.1 hypothetical protein [Planktothrix agardhii 1031]MCF3598826.1 hypothetical protein [Planktothrix agardhii 1032]